MSFRQLEAMRKIGMDEAEIADILETDKRIDRGEKLFELSSELEAGAKKARQADRKQTALIKREHKPNEEKKALIQQLVSAVAPNGEATIINPEREFLFMVGEKKYKVVLSCPRS